MAISSQSLNFIRRKVNGRVREYKHAKHPEWTSTLDLDTIHSDMFSMLPDVVNLVVCDPRLFYTFFHLLDGPINKGDVEYQDRLRYMSIDDNEYVSVKIFVPDVHWVTIASCISLNEEYYMAVVPEKEGRLNLEETQVSLQRIKVES